MARSSAGAGCKDAGRVDEHELAVALDGDAAQRHARRLHLVVTIETLAPTRVLTSVDLPALGAPITATKPQRVSVGVVCRLQSSALTLPHALAREQRRAAACSAARLLAPSPRAGLRPLMRTSAVKRGAWSGPLRSTST